jgi:hypothetical protein
MTRRLLGLEAFGQQNATEHTCDQMPFDPFLLVNDEFRVLFFQVLFYCKVPLEFARLVSSSLAPIQRVLAHASYVKDPRHSRALQEPTIRCKASIAVVGRPIDVGLPKRFHFGSFFTRKFWFNDRILY